MVRNTKAHAIMREAIKHYGVEHQIDKAIEEMSELTKALLKLRNGDGNVGTRTLRANVIEELADVMIMTCQLQMIMDDDVRKVINEKLARLERRMHDGN